MTTNRLIIVVSWCNDLTLPDADSSPLFDLVVTEGSLEVVRSSSYPDVYKSLDPISAAIVGSFHKMAEELYSENPSGFVQGLSALLGRNNLHVSSYTTQIPRHNPADSSSQEDRV